MVYIPQYATSTDPAVLEAIAETLRRDEAFREKAAAFAAEHGASEKTSFWSSNHGGLVCLIGIDGPCPEQGRWTLADRKNGVWRPHLKSDLHKQMREIEYALPEVPGLARSYRGVTDRNGRTTQMGPQLFALEGVAWLRFSAQPADLPQSHYGAARFDGSIWTEALGSAWHAARAALEDQDRSERSAAR